MSRSERLLALLQVLRRHSRPMSGQALAAALDISLRTLYRDIATLQSQGAMIEGAPGVGYVMQPGYMLPPLMFTPEEIEALALGLRWVADRGDVGLAGGARDAMAKIGAVLPAPLRRELEASAVLVGARPKPSPAVVVAQDRLRAAIRAEHKLRIVYRDPQGAQSERVVWPFALVYFDESRVLSAWCELRGDFRNFRCDRIAQAEVLDARYPQRRQALLTTWHQRVRDGGRTILPEFGTMPS